MSFADQRCVAFGGSRNVRYRTLRRKRSCEKVFNWRRVRRMTNRQRAASDSQVCLSPEVREMGLRQRSSTHVVMSLGRWPGTERPREGLWRGRAPCGDAVNAVSSFVGSRLTLANANRRNANASPPSLARADAPFSGPASAPGRRVSRWRSSRPPPRRSWARVPRTGALQWVFRLSLPCRPLHVRRFSSWTTNRLSRRSPSLPPRTE